MIKIQVDGCQLQSGQRVYDNLEHLAINVGQYIRNCKNKNQDPILIIDGVDSGVSINLIHNVRGFLNLIAKDCIDSNLTAHIIVTANNYELVVDYESIWIPTLERFNFSSDNFEDYYNFRDLYFD